MTFCEDVILMKKAPLAPEKRPNTNCRTYIKKIKFNVGPTVGFNHFSKKFSPKTLGLLKILN